MFWFAKLQNCKIAIQKVSHGKNHTGKHAHLLDIRRLSSVPHVVVDLVVVVIGEPLSTTTSAPSRGGLDDALPPGTVAAFEAGDRVLAFARRLCGRLHGALPLPRPGNRRSLAFDALRPFHTQVNAMNQFSGGHKNR